MAVVCLAPFVSAPVALLLGLVFANLENEALVPYNDTLPEAAKINALEVVSKPKWEQSVILLQGLQQLKVSANMKKKAALLEKYAQERIKRKKPDEKSKYFLYQ